MLVYNMQRIVISSEDMEDFLGAILHWINYLNPYSFYSYSSESIVFMIGTHKDIVPDPLKHQRISNLIHDVIFGNPVGNLPNFRFDGSAMDCMGRVSPLTFFPIDNARGRSDPYLQSLIREIEEVVETSPHLHQHIP